MLDMTDKALLNLMQIGFPVGPEPYQVLAERLGITESEVIKRLKCMIQKGVIRRLGCVFDSRKLGYTGTLCAIKVEPAEIEAVTAVINSYPEVSHNYLRYCRYNMWFTVIAESTERLKEIIQEISSQTGKEILDLPSENIFKINVKFKVD